MLLIASTVLSTAMVWEVVPLLDEQTSLGFSRFSSMLFLPMLLVTFVGLLAVPVSARLLERRTVQRVESIPLKLQLRMTCPRCTAEQEFRVGPVRCSGCRAAFIIGVEEPRCECGYLLYQLRGDVYPEWGRAVPDNLKWLTGVESLPG